MSNAAGLEDDQNFVWYRVGWDVGMERRVIVVDRYVTCLLWVGLVWVLFLFYDPFWFGLLWCQSRRPSIRKD